jgi:Ca2+-binding RTX toxin-like protein
MNFVSQLTLSKGTGPGIDNSALFTAIGGSFTFSPTDIRVVPIALQAGQVLSLDVDFGTSNNINPIDTKLWLIDANGVVVASNDTSGSDSGSTGTGDPRLSYTATGTGLLFAVVTHKDNGYVAGSFEFDGLGSDTSVFQMNIGLAELPTVTEGTGIDDVLALTSAQRRFDALDGNDSITAADVRNVIDGGRGDDYLSGGGKSDILFGGNGRDQLLGQGSNDVLIGGRGGDDLFGGDGNDQVMGGNGND